MAAQFTDVSARFPDALVLVDVPIGLRDGGRLERLCDLEARKVLGPRRFSVFPAPTRPALLADDYTTACHRNEEATEGKRRLSKQSFAILPKIREIDQYVRDGSRTRSAIREMHPEVCFWGLNQGRPLLHKKKSSDGYRERIALLMRYLPDADRFVAELLRTYRRSIVQRDDIVDALAGVVTGSRARGELLTIPENPEEDSFGLPMEMAYARA